MRLRGNGLAAPLVGTSGERYKRLLARTLLTPALSLRGVHPGVRGEAPA